MKKMPTKPFVLVKKEYFSASNFNVGVCADKHDTTVVVFKPQKHPKRKTPILQSGWHMELFEQLTRDGDYTPELL